MAQGTHHCPHKVCPVGAAVVLEVTKVVVTLVLAEVVLVALEVVETTAEEVVDLELVVVVAGTVLEELVASHHGSSSPPCPHEKQLVLVQLSWKKARTVFSWTRISCGTPAAL